MYGFNAAHLASVQAVVPSAGGTSHSNQVNILNLPLPEAHLEDGEPLWICTLRRVPVPVSFGQLGCGVVSGRLLEGDN